MLEQIQKAFKALRGAEFGVAKRFDAWNLFLYGLCLDRTQVHHLYLT